MLKQQVIKWGSLAAVLFGIAAYQVVAKDQTFGQTKLLVNDKEVTVEFAYTAAMRAQGLMFRESLCDECGMYFEFASPKYAAMWMKNTNIPLDVAFAKADGTITDIKPLFPHDLTSVGASESVLYALEMNQGWFAKNGVKVGDSIIMLSRDPK